MVSYGLIFIVEREKTIFNNIFLFCKRFGGGDTLVYMRLCGR